MPWYRFTATDATGERVSGEAAAADPDGLAADLARRGLRLEHAAAAGPAGPLSGRDAAEFAQQVSGLVRAGLPLPEGLRALARELAPGPLRRVLLETAGHLERGASLEQALEAQGGRFPPHLRSLVLAGVRTGTLGAVLEQFVRYHNAADDLRRTLWVSLAYPLLLLSCLAAVMGFLGLAIIPKFEAIYADFGINLPALTISLIEASRALRTFGPGLPLGMLLAGLAAAWLGLRLGLSAAWRRRLLVRIPLFGPLWRWASLAQFAHVLALLVEESVPLPEALPLAGGACGDADLAEGAAELADEIRGGRPLAEALGPLRAFPAGLGRILRWAEGDRALPEALHLAAEMFEARARSQGAFVAFACSVAVVLMVLWGIAITVVALFLPLIQLISRLSG